MFNYNELKSLPPQELTEKLILLDRQMLMYHRNAAYKRELVNSYDINADYRSLFNLCVVGICAYNNVTLPNQISREFCKSIMDNLDEYLTPFRVPPMMIEYYEAVFGRGELDYLTNFIEKYENKQNESGNTTNKSRVYTKSTAAGRALAGTNASTPDKNGGFTDVLVLPAMLALIYIAVVVIYFVFFYRG